MELEREEIEMAMQILNAGRRKPVVTSLDWTQPSAPKPHLTLQATADEAAEAAMVRLILDAGKVQKPLVASTAVSQPNASLKPPATLQMTAEEQELVSLVLVAGKPKLPTPAKPNPVPAAPARAQPSVPVAPMRAPPSPAPTARTMTPTERAISDQTARAVHKYRLWEIDRIERGVA